MPRNIDGVPRLPFGGSLAFTLRNGVVTASQPGPGTGVVRPTGPNTFTITFSATGRLEPTTEFDGTLTLGAGGLVTARGFISRGSGFGEWTATRVNS